jgi:hypothetical protein
MYHRFDGMNRNAASPQRRRELAEMHREKKRTEGWREGAKEAQKSPPLSFAPSLFLLSVTLRSLCASAVKSSSAVLIFPNLRNCHIL